MADIPPPEGIVLAHFIVLDDVDGQVQQLVSRINDRTRHHLVEVTNGASYDVARQRDAHEAESRTLARLLAVGAFHGEDAQDYLWLRSLQRLMSARGPFTENPFNGVAEPMRHYPAIMCLWAMGVGAILAGHEKLLARLLLEPTWKPIVGVQTPQPAVRCLSPFRRVIPDAGEARGQYPESHHVRAAGRHALRELEPDDAAYEAACDRLEYLASLVSMDDAACGPLPWTGEFLLGEHRNVAAQVEKELAPGWPLLEGGAFKAAREALHDWMRNQPSW